VPCDDQLYYSGDFKHVIVRRTVLTYLISEFPVVENAAARGAARFLHLSAMPVVAGVACLDAVQLRRTTVVRRTQRRTSSQRIPWELVVIFSFEVLLSHGSSIVMTLDEVSFLLG
jgi:hypothetical protein